MTNLIDKLSGVTIESTRYNDGLSVWAILGIAIFFGIFLGVLFGIISTSWWVFGFTILIVIGASVGLMYLNNAYKSSTTYYLNVIDSNAYMKLEREFGDKFNMVGDDENLYIVTVSDDYIVTNKWLFLFL